MSVRDLIPLLDDLYEITQIPLNLEGWEIQQIADMADWDENRSPGKKIVEIFLREDKGRKRKRGAKGENNLFFLSSLKRKKEALL